MITQRQAISWLEQQIGKSLNWNGYSQCVSLIRYYLQKMGCAQFPGVEGAINMVDVAWHKDHFERIEGNPQPGDIAVWGPTPKNKYGHTDVVVAVFGNKIVCVGQNYINPRFEGKAGSPTARYEWTWPNQRRVVFFRPKFVAEPSAPPPQHKPPKSNDVIAQEVIRGDWGNGEERKKRLAAAGYNYDAVQGIVNALIAAPAKPTPNSAQRTYVIQPGESYWSIEEKFNIPHGTLQNINPWPARAIPKYAHVKLP